MDIFVYSDESGVFDKVHNDYFVYGGLIFLGRESMIQAGRKYSHVEEVIRINGNYTANEELKATRITNSEKGKLYRSLNNEIKFRHKTFSKSLTNPRKYAILSIIKKALREKSNLQQPLSESPRSVKEGERRETKYIPERPREKADIPKSAGYG